MIKALIFDFDGLILDTETAWYESYKETLEELYGYNLQIEDFVKCVGSNGEVFWDFLQTELGDSYDYHMIKDKAGKLHTLKIKNYKERDGVKDFLEDAFKKNLKIALATSSSKRWATTHLTNLKLISYFDILITKDDVKDVKPSPDLFNKAIKELNIRPSEAIVFEDSLNGLIAAQKADLKTIIVPNPITKSLPFKDYHLKLNSMKDMTLKEVISTT
ncbi:uncharacterized protein JNUCC1_01014 [Lentibacillus sp. JNUCC-1]|uniref:HAD family hydrolase n=1 Tax=Lentibacillus sp. JNUCC-1 TaxID=2654513 RepID=UPI0012E831B3|nr:HAD family hydrolase [Lentibacillus sp. JNUCC-1]MUV37208.1 uncharacterized protein [Lentibacillus sp. JNUCC-1]